MTHDQPGDETGRRGHPLHPGPEVGERRGAAVPGHGPGRARRAVDDGRAGARGRHRQRGGRASKATNEGLTAALETRGLRASRSSVESDDGRRGSGVRAHAEGDPRRRRSADLPRHPRRRAASWVAARRAGRWPRSPATAGCAPGRSTTACRPTIRIRPRSTTASPCTGRCSRCATRAHRRRRRVGGRQPRRPR